jgi:hypothetical protein
MLVTAEQFLVLVLGTTHAHSILVQHRKVQVPDPHSHNLTIALKKLDTANIFSTTRDKLI